MSFYEYLIEDLVLFSLLHNLQTLPRYIYGEDPASQNDFFGIVIHEMPESSPQESTSGLGKKNI